MIFEIPKKAGDRPGVPRAGPPPDGECHLPRIYGRLGFVAVLGGLGGGFFLALEFLFYTGLEKVVLALEIAGLRV